MNRATKHSAWHRRKHVPPSGWTTDTPFIIYISDSEDSNSATEAEEERATKKNIKPTLAAQKRWNELQVEIGQTRHLMAQLAEKRKAEKERVAEQKLGLLALRLENLQQLDPSNDTITADMARNFLTSSVDDLDEGSVYVSLTINSLSLYHKTLMLGFM